MVRRSHAKHLKPMDQPNEEQARLLRDEGVVAWNAWRETHRDVVPDLNFAKLQGANLESANLAGAYIARTDFFQANLRRANLTGAMAIEANLNFANLMDADLSHGFFTGASFRGANLRRATLAGTDLTLTALEGADLTEASLVEANLHGANLIRAAFSSASLVGVNLQEAVLVNTRFDGANLTGARIYGISAWDVKLEGANQKDLVITRDGEPKIAVDDLEVAQFIYLLLKNENIRKVIDTIGKKGVLILGRFTVDRKAVLESIRAKLRDLGFVPMIFDFERPTQRDFTETVKTLAGLSRFIIADITNPRSSPLETTGDRSRLRRSLCAHHSGQRGTICDVQGSETEIRGMGSRSAEI